MAIRTKHEQEHQTWFITFTCFNWIPLFEITKSYGVVYKWIKLIADKYHIQTHAFVIMPNHVHIIVRTPDSSVDLNKIVGNGKRFMAYDLVKQLTLTNNLVILDQLSSACTQREKAKGQIHKVFEPSFDAKPIFTTAFLYQKIDYIHHNPVSGKWNLCTDFTEYPHSSAAFYYLEKKHEFVEITDYRDFWVDTDLVKPIGF
ncbi:transposase [Mucilaginibacter sp. FT3.2]|uniref:transposase n=1 Tax=Mucilaginibacter sp. FT3.2 TaxID=2723090 RepID=UPI001611030C|nr:transposase [Mucilaginibacter sp. FT3.2]MBB6233386.1 REP element-mobilizing transposase RayT [Mucilaginibacter sp. FT3.2]